MSIRMTQTTIAELTKLQQELEAKIRELEAEYAEASAKFESLTSLLARFDSATDDRVMTNPDPPEALSEIESPPALRINSSGKLTDAVILAAATDPTKRWRGRDLHAVLVRIGYCSNTNRDQVKVSHRLQTLSVATPRREAIFGLMKRKGIPYYALTNYGVEQAERIRTSKEPMN